MGRLRAAAGTLLFLAVAPGVVGGLVPWLLTAWRSTGPPMWLGILGWALLASGGAALLEAFGRFVIEGIGTPAPVAPTDRLVVGGQYRYVRNPMYLAVGAVILGQAAVLGRWVLVVYAVAFGAIVWSFVHWYEEPTLRQRFGADYEAYMRSVPGWWPRPRTRQSGAGRRARVAVERDLTGIVIPGRRLGSVRMGQSDTLNRMEELVGFSLVPGTLNVRLPGPLERSLMSRYLTAAELAPSWEEETGQAGYFLMPVLVAGRYRGVAFQADEPGYPADQVELLCGVHLRESLGLNDGDPIGFSVLP